MSSGAQEVSAGDGQLRAGATRPREMRFVDAERRPPVFSAIQTVAVFAPALFPAHVA